MDLYNNRKTALFLALVLGLSLGSVGCDQKGDKTAGTSVPQGKVVATVNGEAITEGELDAYRTSRPGPGRGQSDEALLDELVTQKVVYQEALRLQLDKDPEVIRDLEQLRTSLMASAVVRKQMTDNPVTEEELQAEYDKLKDSMVSPEYKASHILVKEEELAKKLIAQLNQGADFAKLAQEHSTDGSGKNGGDLGWFSPQQMVQPFSQAVVQLEKGSYTKEPVQTQFGWHIIKLEDSRQAEPPAFEEVKVRLDQMLKQRKVRDYIQALKDKAEIAMKDAPAVEAPITPEAEKAEPSDAN